MGLACDEITNSSCSTWNQKTFKAVIGCQHDVHDNCLSFLFACCCTCARSTPCEENLIHSKIVLAMHYLHTNAMQKFHMCPVFPATSSTRTQWLVDPLQQLCQSC